MQDATNPRAAEDLDRFSHELRGHLTGIVGLATLLRDGTAGAVSAAQLELLDDLLACAAKLTDLADAASSAATARRSVPGRRPS